MVERDLEATRTDMANGARDRSRGRRLSIPAVEVALLPGFASRDDHPWPRTLRQPPESKSCQELPVGVGKLFLSLRADETAHLASRVWDRAPRLGTPPFGLRHKRSVQGGEMLSARN